MFLHSFIYSIKRLLRGRIQIFWSLLFPLILGTMFYAAFSNLSESEAFRAIPIAIVQNGSETDTAFTDTIDFLSQKDENQLFESIYATKEEALSLLENKQIDGILYDGTPVTLSVSSDMDSEKISQSILSSFVEQFNLHYDAIAAVAKEHPENVISVIENMNQDTAYNIETSFKDGSMEEQLTYFFNLISMICMFGSMAGCMVSIRNQANLSALGARQNCSPVHKLISIFAELCANVLIQFACVIITLCYLIGVLKIDFGNETGYVLLASFIGCILGVCLGFFIGTFGRLKEEPKIGLCVGISLMCCFLSGMMISGMRIIIAVICPWFNQINPTALIADSFYALAIYPSHERYFKNLFLLIIISAVFAIVGFVIVRRKKYASL